MPENAPRSQTAERKQGQLTRNRPDLSPERETNGQPSSRARTCFKPDVISIVRLTMSSDTSYSCQDSSPVSSR